VKYLIYPPELCINISNILTLKKEVIKSK
jgi:hypothetical protein